MTKFVFKSNSADKKPGKGVGEELSEENFNELSLIKNWRRMLSNFWQIDFLDKKSIAKEPLFILDDLSWASVENFFHYVKFRDTNPKYAMTFSFNGGKPWSRNAYNSKFAGKAGMVSKRTGKVYNKKIGGIKLPTNVKIREDFYDKDDITIPIKLQYIAAWSKFTQNPELKKVLLATKNSELYHLVTNRGRASTHEYWKYLMVIRDCIRKFDSEYDLSKITFGRDIVDEIFKIENCM
jgi:hypothetical protein